MKTPEGSQFSADYHLDCSWQFCPVPILMTEEKIKEIRKGAVLEVLFTDRGAKADLDAWCRATGNDLMGFKEEKIRSFAYIRKS
jgi:tRNA 2-thiouridine synthesizing protein A